MEKRGFLFHGTDGEAELSIEQVEALAARDDPDGVYALAMALIFGWDTEMDEVRGYGLLEHAVELGSTDAMALMVRLYMQDEYDGIDNERAAELAIRAAEDGVPDAQLYAGLAYMDGVSVPQDHARAARYLSLAANQGEQEARTALAYLYENGLGVAKDETKALRMYRTAARGGSVNAMFHTGVCYEFGTGTRADPAKAAEWYRKGAEAGDAFAMERLGHLLFQEDPEEGFEWFLKAALEGVSTAMGTVGFCYLNGAGTERNAEEAGKWLRMAADNGVEEASEALAGMPPERSPADPLLRQGQPQDRDGYPGQTGRGYPLRQDDGRDDRSQHRHHVDVGAACDRTYPLQGPGPRHEARGGRQHPQEQQVPEDLRLRQAGPVGGRAREQDQGQQHREAPRECPLGDLQRPVPPALDPRQDDRVQGPYSYGAHGQRIPQRIHADLPPCERHRRHPGDGHRESDVVRRPGTPGAVGDNCKCCYHERRRRPYHRDVGCRGVHQGRVLEQKVCDRTGRRGGHEQQLVAGRLRTEDMGGQHGQNGESYGEPGEQDLQRPHAVQQDLR